MAEKHIPENSNYRGRHYWETNPVTINGTKISRLIINISVPGSMGMMALSTEDFFGLDGADFESLGWGMAQVTQRQYTEKWADR